MDVFKVRFSLAQDPSHEDKDEEELRDESDEEEWREESGPLVSI